MSPQRYRSEAFAEDLEDRLVDAPPRAASERRVWWLVNWLPLGVALAGLAFAVVPPLT